MKLLLFLPAIFILLSFPLEAQLNSSTTIQTKGAKKECEFSLFIHRSYSGPLTDIRTSMNLSQQTGSTSTPDLSVIYPDVRILIPISFTFKYNISQRSGISFSTERLDAFTILRDDQSPRVKSILGATSLNYVYSFGHNRHELISGISVIIHRMKPSHGDHLTSLHAETKNLGINFGYSFHMIESKGFFLALHAQYTLAGTSSIGPYSITEPSYDYDILGLGLLTGTVPARTTSFSVTKVHLNSFNIGLSIGFRFGKDVASSYP